MIAVTSNITSGRKKGPGRPKLDEYTKLKRRVFRALIRLDEARSLQKLAEGNLGFLKIQSRGKDPVSKANDALEKALNELRSYEHSEGCKAVSIDIIRSEGDISIVKDDLKIPVGRKKNSELDKLDADLRENKRIILRIENEEQKKQKGRKPGVLGRPVDSKEQRIQKMRVRQAEIIQKIETLESWLDDVELAEREVKKARDKIRLIKLDFKRSPPSGSQNVTELTEYIAAEAELKSKIKSLKTVQKRKELLNQVGMLQKELSKFDGKDSSDSKVARNAIERQIDAVKLQLVSV